MRISLPFGDNILHIKTEPQTVHVKILDGISKMVL